MSNNYATWSNNFDFKYHAYNEKELNQNIENFNNHTMCQNCLKKNMLPPQNNEFVPSNHFLPNSNEIISNNNETIFNNETIINNNIKMPF